MAPIPGKNFLTSIGRNFLMLTRGKFLGTRGFVALIADVFVTIKPGRDITGRDRCDLSVRSLRSLLDNTDRSSYRLTVCVDGSLLIGEALSDYDERVEYIGEFIDYTQGIADYVLQSRQNEGLGPTINRAIAHIQSVNEWHSDERVGNPTRVAPYIVMCQDDLLYTRDWLPILASRFRAYGMQHRLGFASGLECIEHPVKRDLSNGIILKDWIRAAHVLGTREYWTSLMPIPAFDPETGRLRAKPNDGMGSGVDWWLIRNHENSVCRTGRTCLVMPGLVQHAGYDRSTWLARELPESDADKERISNG